MKSTWTHARRDPKWVNILFLTLTPLFAFTLIPWYLAHQSVAWPLWVLTGVLCAFTSMSITIGYHRLFAHRTFESNTWLQVFTLFFGAGAFQGPALEWCTDHRRHHRCIDSKDDPYNIQEGFLWAHVGWLFFHEEEKYRGKFAPDLLKDRLVMWQHNYYVPVAIFAGFIVPMLLGWALGAPLGGLLIAGLGRVVFTQHCTFLINSACHYFGRRPFSDRISARDNVILAFFTYGEGYHNYHHQFQADYRNGIRWYDWDPTKWTIRTLAYLGQTRKLKRVHPSEILKARLQNDESRLLKRGISAERLAALKTRVFEAQQRVKQLHEDYKRLKSSVSQASREQLINLKAELRLARAEFRQAVIQWRIYYRTMRVLPVVC